MRPAAPSLSVTVTCVPLARPWLGALTLSVDWSTSRSCRVHGVPFLTRAAMVCVPTPSRMVTRAICVNDGDSLEKSEGEITRLPSTHTVMVLSADA